MKLISKLTIAVLAFASCVVLFTSPVKAASGMPSTEELFLKKQMTNQVEFNNNVKAYIDLQNQRAKAEKRKVSDIEMLKRQALEGMVTGNNNLLEMGATTIGCGQPSGEYNIAYMDQQAYEGFVSGMAELERIKRETWMTYTFRTH